MSPFPESPRYLSLFQGNLFSLHCLDFQAEDGLTAWLHVGYPCAKAKLESLVGNPLGKSSRENHRFLDPRIGNPDTLVELGRKVHVHAPPKKRTERNSSVMPQEAFPGVRVPTGLSDVPPW